ncbi:Protein ABIL2 [Ananas comosus]|uniref:Protein ABIL2 n=1 Tax=Ananas comosus TaxID=4615 RepID=A0A199VVI0_ANACO|nr:Protein ABIL2 [Ananas comosus]
MLKNLKDYTITALLSTVDHLGSISHKIDDLLDEKIDEVSRLDFRVSCIEQYSMDTQNSAAMRLRGERNNQKEMDRSSNKSRSFLKLLLTRRRSRENESLYSYLNEY